MSIPSTTAWQEQYKHPISNILKEDGFFLLQENGDKLVLEQTGNTSGQWTNQQEH